MKAWHGVLTITVVATLLGLAFYDRMAGSENQALVQRMEAALSTGNAYRKQLAKVKTIQVVRTQRFREFVLVADTASTDSARVIALRAAVGACSTALLACSERALLAEARVAGNRLQTAARATPRRPTENNPAAEFENRLSRAHA